MNPKKRILSFNQIKKDLKNKTEIKKSLIFLIFFLTIFLVVYLFLNFVVSVYINYIYGYLSNFIVSNLLSIKTSFIFKDGISIILLANLQYPIFITSLCTGILEFSLLGSAILASRGISIKKRIIGFLLSIPTVFIFNLIRIIVTIFFIVYLSIPIAEFLHSFLFRIFLIVLVIGFYYLWFKVNYK